MPVLQFAFVGGVIMVGGFASWIGVCVNLCCRNPVTEREKEAAWYVNVTAAINGGHLLFLIASIFLASTTRLWWFILVGVHGNMFSMIFTNGLMLALLFFNDQKVEKRQKEERAALGPALLLPPPIMIGGAGQGVPTVVGTPVQVGSNNNKVTA